MKPNLYLDFLRDPDQATRRAELASFIGPNAAKFMPIYDKLHADAATGSGRPKFRLLGGGFSWTAFLCGPVWFFYRKMWLIAGIIVISIVAFALIPGTSRAGAPIGIALGLLAYRTYLQHAILAIQKMRRPDGSIAAADLARVGGVSKTAGWISGVIYGLITLAALVSIIMLLSAGVPIPQ